jgi:hypothetical protein
VWVETPLRAVVKSSFEISIGIIPPNLISITKTEIIWDHKRTLSVFLPFRIEMVLENPIKLTSLRL